MTESTDCKTIQTLIMCRKRGCKQQMIKCDKEKIDRRFGEITNYAELVLLSYNNWFNIEAH